MKIYQFKPLLKQTLWGGDKIIPFKRLNVQMDNVGESWEISGVPGNETIVSEGPERGKSLNQLVHEQKGALVGEENYRRFPGSLLSRLLNIDEPELFGKEGN